MLDIAEFKSDSLKPTETEEKDLLPSSETIAQELEHLKFKVSVCVDIKDLKKFVDDLIAQDGIEGYDKTQLCPTETMEKNTLPSKEVIDMEKTQ